MTFGKWGDRLFKMKIVLSSPTRAYISQYSDEELVSLREQLTYKDLGVAHELKRISKNHYFRSSNPEKWELTCKMLKEQVYQTLVFEEDGLLYIRPGSIPYLEGNFEIDNQIKYPKPKKLAWYHPLPFSLYDYQKDSVNRLLEAKHGNVNICTGGGKTAIILQICRELGVQTTIVTPSSSIFNEILEKAEYHFGKGKVGAYGDGKKRFGKLITVATSKSLAMLEPNSEEYKFFEKTQSFLGDECFPYRTKILTEDGSKEIGIIHKEIQQGKEIKVLSFNEKTKQYEYKKVTNSWQRERKDKLVQISCSMLQFSCTEDHSLLTSVGWKKAVDIQEGEFLVGYRGEGSRSSVSKIMNPDQEQVFLGSYLGDGSVSTHANGVRCRIIHGIKQEEYLRWKANIFGVTNIERTEKNGYAQKPAVRFCTQLVNSPMPMKFSMPKGGGISEVLNRLDARGVAIWFMDDGSTSLGYSRLHTESFPIEIQKQFVVFFRQKFNIEATIRECKGDDFCYYYLKFDRDNSQKLADLITDYVHPSMRYKIGNIDCGQYVWCNKYLEYGYTKVTRKVILEPSKRKNYVRTYSIWNLFDLEVEDNHNFVVGKFSGIVAHNCHTLPSETLEAVCHGVLQDAPYRFFFSGSPTRADGAEKLLQSIIGETVLTLTTREAVEKGYVSPHEFRIVQIQSSDPNLGSTDALEIKRFNFLRSKDICNFIAKLCNSLAAKGEQILVLCEETNQISMLLPKLTVPTVIAHSEKSNARLQELGIPKVDPAESVEKFNKREAMVLLGTSCISTGTNIYPMTHTVNWQGGASEVKTKQGAVGRSVRLPRANPWAKLCGQKKNCTIWDFDVVGNYVLERHLEERIACYKDSGDNLIKYVRLK